MTLKNGAHQLVEFTGKTVSLAGYQKRQIEVGEFRSIPFAEPPTGKNRFQNPKPFRPTPETRQIDTRSLPKSCWQVAGNAWDQANKATRMWLNNTGMSEDCLYLSVWTPYTRQSEVEAGGPRKPVLVWVYGGYFNMGTISIDVYDGSVLAGTQNVVVVSINYRLGPMGFLYFNLNGDAAAASTADQLAPGNMALMDLVEALKWVRAHIHHFGGDRDSVTVIGESAGGVNAALLMHSPLAEAEQLLNRVIVQSGSPLSRWATESKEMGFKKSLQISKACGCGDDPKKLGEIQRCMEKVAPLDLVNQQYVVNTHVNADRRAELTRNAYPIPGSYNVTSLYFDVTLRPIVDGSVVSEPVDQMLPKQKRKKKTIDLMIGVNANEAIFFLLYGLMGSMNFHMNSTMGTIGAEPPAVLANTNNETVKSQVDMRDIIIQQIVDKDYLHVAYSAPLLYNYKIPSQFRDPNNALLSWTARSAMSHLDAIASDIDFICPTVDYLDMLLRWAEKASPDMNVYLYLFSERNQKIPLPDWFGVMHGYEIEYMMGMPFSPNFINNFYGFETKDKKISDRMMRFWANFARNRDPNDVGKNDWKKFNLREKAFINISSDSPNKEFKTGFRLHEDQCEFWRYVMQSLKNNFNSKAQIDETCKSALPVVSHSCILECLFLVIAHLVAKNV